MSALFATCHARAALCHAVCRAEDSDMESCCALDEGAAARQDWTEATLKCGISCHVLAQTKGAVHNARQTQCSLAQRICLADSEQEGSFS